MAEARDRRLSDVRINATVSAACWTLNDAVLTTCCDLRLCRPMGGEPLPHREGAQKIASKSLGDFDVEAGLDQRKGKPFSPSSGQAAIPQALRRGNLKPRIQNPKSKIGSHSPFRIWADRFRMLCLSRRCLSERTCICRRSAARVWLPAVFRSASRTYVLSRLSR